MKNSYGEEFYRLRMILGITQKQVGNLLGYKNAQYVSNVERGLGYFRIEHLRLLKSEFGFPVENLAKIHAKEMSVKKLGEYKKTFPRASL